MTASRPDRRLVVAAALVALLLLAGCRTPGARPIGGAIDVDAHFATRVPDVADYAAAELATAALISDRERAQQLLRRIRSIDTVLVTAGDLPTGLAPVAADLVNATFDSPRVYHNATLALLSSDDLDPAMRERLTQSVDDDPLELADERMDDAHMIEFARAFNALSEPIGRSILTSAMAPYRLASSLMSYALEVYTDDPLPLQQRQALAHWKDFVDRNPNAPESALLRPRIQRAQAELNRTIRDHTMVAAKRAYAANQSRLALVYADRALHYVPEDPEASKLREEAEQRILEERVDRERSLAAPVALPIPPREEVDLAVALLDPTSDLEGAAKALLVADSKGPLADEAEFAVALALADAGEEDAMWELLDGVRDDDSNMSRHAAALIRSPVSNAYAAFTSARSQDRKHQALWVFFGPYAKGVPERGLPEPVEWMIGLPTVTRTMVGAPLRLIQLPWLDTLPAARVAAVYGRRYLEMHPDGEHAEDVRDWLMSHEKGRDNWIAVHHLAEDDPDVDQEELDELNEKAAQQALDYTAREQRRDLRHSMYRRIAREYAGTEAGQRAGEIAGEEARSTTAQKIQITRGFLLENPEVAGPEGLALAPRLLDDDNANGELHPAGVELVGGRHLRVNYVAASGDDEDPPTSVYTKVSEERLARLVAALEESSFENQLVDHDDQLGPDAHRDVYFERARLGLTDQVDQRALAGSNYSYRGMRERYGMVRARESVLPFELVIQGSLTDMSLGAFPRMTKPRKTPDAFLYQ